MRRCKFGRRADGKCRKTPRRSMRGLGMSPEDRAAIRAASRAITTGGSSLSAPEKRKARAALKRVDKAFAAAAAAPKGRRTTKAQKASKRKAASGRGKFCVMTRTPKGTRSECFSTQAAAVDKFEAPTSALLYKRVRAD